MEKIASGIWPTMITPFTADNRLDEEMIPRMIDWYAQKGCDGVFAVCQSSEMFYLSLEERVRLARLCVESAKGRLQVIASGHISASPEDQIRELRAMAETGVKAVVLVSNRLAREDEDDDAWIAAAEKLVAALPGVTLGMYECPYPYKRLLTEKTIRWMAGTGRFAFLKDTCSDADVIRDRIRIIREATPAGKISMGLYNANTMTLLSTLRAGADGFCGVMGNMHPELYCWLYTHFSAEPEKAQELQAMLTMLSTLETQGYPICAKQHMRDEGIPMTLVNRTLPPDRFREPQKEALRQSEIVEKFLRQQYGSCPVDQ